MQIDDKAIQSQLMEWLNRRTHEYNLEYLDPLICDDEISQFARVNLTWLDPHVRGAGTFLRDLRNVAYDKAAAGTPANYLDDKGVGTKVKTDRSLQRKISETVNRHCETGNLRYFATLDAMKGQKQELHTAADKDPADSLIIMDTMFATRAYLPAEITQTIDIPPRRRNGSVRSLQGALTDLPGYLATMGNQIVPLLMDERVVNRWTIGFDTLMSGGWYPAVRIVGLCRTRTCGHSYIDVIALLARPWPTLDELVAGGSSTASDPDLPQILDNVRARFIAPILADLTEQSPGTVPPSASSPAADKRLEFTSYKELLVPLLFFQVFGYLNGVSAKTLRTRAHRAYKALVDYIKALKELEPYLDEQSQELRVIVDIDRLLPEPPHLGRSLRAIVA